MGQLLETDKNLTFVRIVGAEIKRDKGNEPKCSL